MNPVISNNFALTALKQGEDAFVCDLTNQMDAVPVDANGKVTSKTDVSTTARIIKGAGIIPSGITPTPAASMVIAGVTPTVNIADGEVTYTWSFAKGTTVSDARYVKKRAPLNSLSEYLLAFSIFYAKIYGFRLETRY